MEALLAHGAASSAAEKTSKGRTAADLAEARGASALAVRLRVLEPAAALEEREQGRCSRCEICQRKLRRGQTKLEVRGGEGGGKKGERGRRERGEREE